MQSFFANSECIDYEALRPISHILSSWETTWDRHEQKYAEEEESYAATLNDLIVHLSSVTPPRKHHDNENRLAEYVVEHLKWPIREEGKPWVGEDYDVILQQSGFHDVSKRGLVTAAAGWIRAAIERDQCHYDEMEEGLPSSHARYRAYNDFGSSYTFCLQTILLADAGRQVHPEHERQCYSRQKDCEKNGRLSNEGEA